MKTLFFPALMSFAALVHGGFATGLPEWAQSIVLQTDMDQAPADAAIWELLDETAIEMRPDGRLAQTRRVVRCVLKSRGAARAGLFLVDGDAKASRIKKLRGWHRHPRGKTAKLDKSNVVTLSQASIERITSDTTTFAHFRDVTKGSVVVFESEEIHEAFFTVSLIPVLKTYPVRKRVIRLALGSGTQVGKTVTLQPFEFESWGLTPQLTLDSLTVENLPGIEDERYQPDYPDPYPWVLAGFGQTDKSGPLASWDNLARWYLGVFKTAFQGAEPGAGRAPARADLDALVAFMDGNISYRQEYLSYGRGWTPMAGVEVERLAYGDCKDMVACAANRAAKKDMRIYPALANIGDGYRTNPDSPVAPAFNHLISAIHLPATMDLTSEVVVGDQRYLLWDPTSKYTPLGKLPAEYRERSVLICTPAGAAWAAVPEAALEKEEVRIELAGTLDANFTFRGSMQVSETGNAEGLRTLYKSGNQRDLLWAIRYIFDIPGATDLRFENIDLDADHRLDMILVVSWPAFLRRDAGGLRLPLAIAGTSAARLAKPGNERQSPIAFSARPKTVWNLAIQSEKPLRAGMGKAGWKGDYHAFSWEAQGGQQLQVTFTTERQRGYFPKSALAEGLTYWKGYRQAFNSFWFDGTLFFP